MSIPDYQTFTLRNDGYVSKELQERISKTRILIAGCGIGSTIAEALLRVGFIHLTLIDGDKVEAHNLNRQDFTAEDIGVYKVDALSRRLKKIYPQAVIETVNGLVSPSNAASLVGQADFVFDTIDFLSLEAIVALHDACQQLKKPVVSALSAGFGAMAIYFPVGGACSFRKIFDLPEQGVVGGYSYVDKFSKVIKRLESEISPDILAAMAKALTVMDDGTPCPAPQVSSGSWSVAALAVTMITRIMQGLPVTAAPRMVSLNMANVCSAPGINLL